MSDHSGKSDDLDIFMNMIRHNIVYAMRLKNKKIKKDKLDREVNKTMKKIISNILGNRSDEYTLTYRDYDLIYEGTLKWAAKHCGFLWYNKGTQL